MTIFSVIFGSMWLLFSFAVKVTEGSLPINPNPFKHYENCVWFIGITTTSVGFGDITVFSDAGRILSFFCAIWGSFNVSIIVVLLINTLSLGPKEKKSLVTMNKID